MAIKINENGIDRDMTASEETAYLAWAKIAQAEAETRKDAQTAHAAAKLAVISKLGLTQDEAAALLG